MRSRISIKGYVRPSVRQSIGRSICQLVHPSVTHELKPCKSAVFDYNYYQYQRERILCRLSGLVVLTGEEEFWNPEPTNQTTVGLQTGPLRTKEFCHSGPANWATLHLVFVSTNLDTRSLFRCVLASLYDGLSVHPSVRPSVRPSVCPSVRPLVRSPFFSSTLFFLFRTYFIRTSRLK